MAPAPSDTSPENPSSADRDDFAALYSGCHLPLLRYIMTLVPHRDQAEDVLQNTARSLWKRFDQYDTEKPFLPWARKFAYFECLRHRKEFAVRSQRIFSDELIETLADEREQLDDVLAERRAALQDCLGQIDGPSRELLIIRYGDDRSVTDVAQSTGKSRNALYLILHRLRKTLIECVNRQLDVEGWAR